MQVGKPDSRIGQPDETEARNQRHRTLVIVGAGENLGRGSPLLGWPPP
nr:MAG TPA: hypothetical protein [Caudoviricetes sp.]